LLKNVISAYTERWLLILGVVYILTILVAPQGVWNLGRAKAQGPRPKADGPRQEGDRPEPAGVSA
jgi:hypothetical protein